MLSPKQQKYADRIGELIIEGHRVSTLERGRVSQTGVMPSTYMSDEAAVHAWMSKTENILTSVFGAQSTQVNHYQALTHRTGTANSLVVRRIVGLLSGAKSDLENGFLIGQEFLIAADVFDSLLEQARHLNENGFKDCAAVLARVALEDALKRLARANGVAIVGLANRINDDLKGSGVFSQPQWRLNQACLDVGNAAAHGDFNTYSKEDVAQRIDL
jgi:hypothetical protein